MSQAALRGSARMLEDALADFGIKGEIRDIKPGPVITLFELEPSRGTKSSRVIGLADDIARSMSAMSVRVAVVPGRNAIGIELPNARRDTVVLRELLESDAFRASDGAVADGARQDRSTERPVVADLGAHAASAGGGNHGLGQVRRASMRWSCRCSIEFARRLPLHDDRSQDAGAVGLQRHSASAVSRRDGAAEGGGGAQLGR